jgi:thioredoxin 1
MPQPKDKRLLRRTCVLELNSDAFASEVLEAQQPVVVDFWGPRCGPCMALMPHVEKLAAEHEGKVKFVKVDASKNRRLCLELRVLSLPTYLFYKQGKEVARLTGGDVKLPDIEKHAKELL